jgi:uncharacterized protein YjiS (DUF1127 family)
MKKGQARDWESIEKDYRANVLSIREVGKLHSISDKAIRNKAKEFGWERDLSAKVAEKVRSELVRSESAPADAKKTEQEIVDAAAATVVQVVRSHRVRIRQGNELTELLTKQLTDVAGKREEFETAIEIVCAEDKSPERMARLMKAVSLEKHAAIACNLANATKTWVGLERQAFSIEDGAEKDLENLENRRYTDAELAVQMAYILSKQ